jgi:hypothetical protein
MAVPLVVRALAAVAGGLLILLAWSSVVGTLIVSRSVHGRLTRWIDGVVVTGYRLVTHRTAEYRRLDRVLSTQAAAILMTQLLTWMALVFAGFTLLLWPFAARGLGGAFSDAGSSMFTLGFAVPSGSVPSVLVFAAAFSGLVIVTLQIAYLPTLYASFNRRETDVALLTARAGVPAWGPELLARTQYALGAGISTLDTLPDLYTQWERWAADVAESHTTYLPLVRFRSPRPMSSWVTALLAVLDSAAMYLALSPSQAPVAKARLCLRSGFECFTRVAQAMGVDVPDEVTNGTSVDLSYDQFLKAVERLREVDFPIERDPADAWPDFTGWRVNYERAAYGIAAAVDAVPAMWSGPRRRDLAPIAPFRPAPGRADTRHPMPKSGGRARDLPYPPDMLSTACRRQPQVIHRNTQRLSTICGERDYASRIAEISNSRVTFSLTRTPPASSGAFQLTPQSLRLITTEPSKPARKLPNGSVAVPSKVNGIVTGFVTPRTVRSPVRSKLSSPVCSAAVDTKVISGYSSIARKSLPRR